MKELHPLTHIPFQKTWGNTSSKEYGLCFALNPTDRFVQQNLVYL